MLISVLATMKIAKYFGLRLGFWPVLFCAVSAVSIEIVLPSLAYFAGNHRLVLLLSVIVVSATLITYWNEMHPVRGAAPACEQSEAPLAPQAVERPPLESRALAESAPDTPMAAPCNEMASYRQTNAARPSRLPAIVCPTILERIENEMSQAASLDARAAILRLKTLDAILDYAYEQKYYASLDKALFAFKHALERYLHDDYAPFITIEIGNIYKNTGLYDEAIVIYNKAFCLRAVRASLELKREFQNMIYYLHITKEVLYKYHSLKTPFDQVPECILQEIEIEFQFWLSQKYAS